MCVIITKCLYISIFFKKKTNKYDQEIPHLHNHIVYHRPTNGPPWKGKSIEHRQTKDIETVPP